MKKIQGVWVGLMTLVLLGGAGAPLPADPLGWGRDTGTLPAAASGAPMTTRTLAEFETAARQGPEVLAAVAELEASLGQLDLAQADGGWRVFGGAGAGQFREQVSTEAMRSYERIDLRAGLKYPLLGSKNREQETVVKMQALSEEKIHDKALAIRDSLLSLRLHYINYWAAQEQTRLAELFLQNEAEMEHILTERTASGHLLEADRREGLSSFALVRRQLAQFQAVRQRAMGVLSLMNGVAVAPFEAAFPEMAPPCEAPETLTAAVLAAHPRLLRQRQAVEERSRLAELAQKSQVNGQVALYSNLSSEMNAPEPGYGVGVDLSFDFPLHSRQAGSARRQTAQAALEASRRRLEIVRAQLLIEAQETLNGYRTAEKSCAFAVQRLAAARERLRENILRAAYLPGDVLEKAQQARWNDYQAALELIEAWVQRLQLHARLLHLAPAEASAAAGPRPTAWPPGPAGALNDPRRSFSVYVWDSARLRDARPEALLADLRRQNIGRLLLGFTAAQTAALAAPDERRKWRDLIESLQRGGVRVELLLGEPLWMLAAHRPRLLALIRDLTELPFAGLHLDLEPDQIATHGPGQEDLRPRLLETVRAVKAQTSLPVGLSLHYRYLDPMQPEHDMGARLAELAVDEVTLMIYVADPGRVAAIARPILKAHPDLLFSIAQSLEPELGPRESHAGLACAPLHARMDQLRELLAEAAWNGIVLQSWKEYDGVCP
jgi:outer membrane protein TolC